MLSNMCVIQHAWFRHSLQINHPLPAASYPQHSTCLLKLYHFLTAPPPPFCASLPVQAMWQSARLHHPQPNRKPGRLDRKWSAWTSAAAARRRAKRPHLPQLPGSTKLVRRAQRHKASVCDVCAFFYVVGFVTPGLKAESVKDCVVIKCWGHTSVLRQSTEICESRRLIFNWAEMWTHSGWGADLPLWRPHLMHFGCLSLLLTSTNPPVPTCTAAAGQVVGFMATARQSPREEGPKELTCFHLKQSF